MTQDELSASVHEIKSGFLTLSQELAELKRLEISRHKEELAEKEKREVSERAKIERELAEWQSRQTFIGQHGTKILSVLFAVVSAGLAWYGSQIRSEIDAEQQAIKIETAINQNKTDLKTFKDEATKDIEELQLDSIKQTIMIDEGFKRVDKVILMANPRRLKEEDLPEVEPEFKEAVDDARRKKEFIDRFGQDSMPKRKRKSE